MEQNENSHNTKATPLSSHKLDKTKLKGLIKETLYNSFAQVIIKIIETPYYTLKTFLFICLIASSGICSYLIVELIMGYLSYGVSTTSRTLYETPATFPKVTICNANPFTTQYAVEFLKKINQKINLQGDILIDFFDDEQMSRLNFSTTLLIVSVIVLARNEMNTNLNETEKKKLSHSLEDMLGDCSFNDQPCSADDFTWYFDPYYGNCWMFNTGLNQSELKSNSLPGENYGLNVMMYVNYYENLSTINSYSYLGGRGGIVRIENSSYLTSFNTLDGIKITPGGYTSVSVSRLFKSSLPRPYSNCLIDNQTNAGFQSKLFNLIQNSPYRYTQSLCFMQCKQRAILLECNCTTPLIKSLFSNVSQCHTYYETYCESILPFKKQLFEENCLSECPLECYFDQFETSLSFIELIPNFEYDFLMSNSSTLTSDFVKTKIDFEVVSKSFVYFNIFYKSLSYDISTESPQMNLVTLISNIASNLGLFLGVSVFSVFEPIQVLIEIYFYLKLSKNKD